LPRWASTSNAQADLNHVRSRSAPPRRHLPRQLRTIGAIDESRSSGRPIVGAHCESSRSLDHSITTVCLSSFQLREISYSQQRNDSESHSL
jgi:hypothetical protein